MSWRVPRRIGSSSSRWTGMMGKIWSMAQLSGSDWKTEKLQKYRSTRVASRWLTISGYPARSLAMSEAIALRVARWYCSMSAMSRRVIASLAKSSWRRSLANTASWKTSSTRSSESDSRFSLSSTSTGGGSSRSAGITGSVSASTSVTLMSSRAWWAVSARPDSEMMWGIGALNWRHTVPRRDTTALADSRLG